MLDRLRIVYWISLSLAVFLVHDPRFVAVVLAFHCLLLPILRIPLVDAVRPHWRMKYLFLFLIVAQMFFPPGRHFLHDWLSIQMPDFWQGLTETRSLVSSQRNGWAVGFVTGFYQSIQISTVVLLTTVIRCSGSGNAFLNGMRGLFVPRASVEIIDACLKQLETRPRPSQPSRRRESVESATNEQRLTPSRSFIRPWTLMRSALRGDVDWLIKRIEEQIEPADSNPSETTPTDHDVRLLSRITFVLMSLRMLKLTPGTGLTPGHQNLIVVPLLCLAAARSRRRWSATLVGSSAGTLSVMLGLGRNGLFILPAHILPGLVIDLGWPKTAGTVPSRWKCMRLGAAAGFARFTGMLCVLLLLDNPELLAAVPFLSFGHIVFGFASGAITHILVTRLNSPRST